MSDATNPKTLYGEDALFVIEPHGIEHIDDAERHGRVSNLFMVWFASNMHLSVWTIGALAIILGCNLTQAVTSILLGTAIGALGVGLAVAMGPRLGMPQIPQSRSSFGFYGNYVPAILAWLGFLGWFTVNNILGGQTIAQVTHLPYLVAMLLLSLITIGLALYGHNLIHGFEKVMTWFVGLVFLVMTGIIVFAHVHVTPAPAAPFAVWLSEFTIMFSYAVSWAPYGADYGRYLPADTPVYKPMLMSAAGLFASICWVGILGAVTASAFKHVAPIPLIGKTMGGFAIVAYIALALGSMSSNVLNIYSGSLAALTFNLPLKRWASALIIGGISIALSLYFGTQGRFVSFIDNFLLFLAYWVTPWLGIQCVEFYFNRKHGRLYRDVLDFYRPRGPFGTVNWKGLGSFLIGLAVSVPFMASSYYTGPIGHALKGADISYIVSFVVSGVLYWVWSAPDARRWREQQTTVETAG